MQNNFLDWLSEGNQINNTQLFYDFEKEFDINLPESYKNLVRHRDGGTLKKDIFYYDFSHSKKENGVGLFLCWQNESSPSYYSHLVNVYKDPPEFFPKSIVPFSQDGGGNYLCFDYRNCTENPPIVFWHHAIEENEGIFYLADSFEEFISSLKSEEELDD